MKISSYAAILLAAMWSFSTTAVATTLIDNDFSAVNTSGGTVVFNDGSTIPGTTSLDVFSDSANNFSQVADVGGNALQFVDNNSSSALSGVSASFTPMSTGSSGENQLSASFSLSRLSLGSGSGGTAIFGFGDSTTISGASTAIQFQINGQNGVVGAFIGDTFTGGLFTMDADTDYTFNIAGDFSSDTQDTWSLVILDGAVEVYNSGSINTRADNVSVSDFVVRTGGNAGNASPDPFLQIDSILATSAVPEPSSAMLAGGALLSVILIRKRRLRH